MMTASSSHELDRLQEPMRGALAPHRLELDEDAPVGAEAEAILGERGEAFDSYCLVRERARAHRRDIQAETRVLDFGCGWGRITRFFLRDVDHWNLFGCDCYPEALTAAQDGTKWGSFRLIEPLPPSPFESGSFDVIFLYSVFSHLSEEAHLEWLREFHRILKPGDCYSRRRGSGSSSCSVQR